MLPAVDYRDDSRRACKDVQPEVFFDESSENIRYVRLEFCSRCPVRLQCEQWALTHYGEIQYGIFAGWSSKQRRRIAAGRRRFAPWMHENFGEPGFVSRSKARANIEGAGTVVPLTAKVEWRFGAKGE